MVDQTFTTYEFKAAPADGAQSARTLPERLTEIVNVKDFGARGDGTTDDSAAINAAIDYIYTLPLNETIVYFPPGIYIIGSPPLFVDRDQTTWVPNRWNRHTIQGAGRKATIIKGTYSTGAQLDAADTGMLVQAGYYGDQTVCIRDISIINESQGINSAALGVWYSPGLTITNCYFKGFLGVVAGVWVTSCYIQGCICECSVPITDASAATLAPARGASIITSTLFMAPSGVPEHGNQYGSVGIYSAGTMVNCQAIGFDCGFAIPGPLKLIIGCTVYRCGMAVLSLINGDYSLGGGDFRFESSAITYGNWGIGQGVSFRSNIFERCHWSLYLSNQASTAYGANIIKGKIGPWNSAPISTLGWNNVSHIVTVTTVDDHNIVDGTLVVIDSPPDWTIRSDGFVTATVTGAKTFTYPGPASAPPGSPTYTGGSWNYPIEYGITGNSMGGNSFIANSLTAAASKASFDIIDQGVSSQSQNVCMSMRGPYGWKVSPANVHGAGWEFISCGASNGTPSSGCQAAPAAYVNLLPDGTANPAEPGPFDGQEYTVVNANVQPDFGGPVTLGGVNHYKVRYNSATGNWVRIG